MAIVLGVDGGGTGTHAAIADDSGRVLGFGKSGAANWEDVGIDAAGAALRAAVREAFIESGVGPADIASTAFGRAGIDFPSDELKMGGIAAALGITTGVQMLNDSFVALRAGANQPWGVVVICGTGSVVAGKNPAGETFRTLGLGPVYGDYGSGTDVSESAIAAVAAQVTGKGPRTALTERMCEVTGTASAMDLIEGLARGRIDETRFAPAVFEVADRGDRVARRLLEDAGARLGDTAGLIAERLQMEDSEFELVMTGAMFRFDSRVLSTALEASVKRRARLARPVRLEAPPVVGALLLALEAIGSSTDPELHASLAMGCNEAMQRRFG
jgi:N-acetylglucosamine kinase-like BadF-type ATPase